MTSKSSTSFHRSLEERSTKVSGSEQQQYVPPRGWGEYMANKTHKLQGQYDEDVSLFNSERSSNIFTGCVIHINGYTQPSAAELRRMIIMNGGTFTQYPTSNITHTIATQLPTVKINALRERDLIIRPEWIVECVKQKRLLSVDNFRLYTGKGGGVSNQPSMSSFVSTSATSMPPPAPPPPKRPGSARRPSAAENPAEFIADFYRRSRLHHLSTWRSDFQLEMQLRIARMSSQQRRISSADTIPSNSHRVLLYVDMDCFFASVALLKRPHLRGKPLAVCHSAESDGNRGAGTRGADVSSCSYEARAFGVRNGMGVNRALKLCPQLVLVPYDFDEYERVSREFYDVLLNYSRTIEVRSVDEAILDVTKTCTPADANALASKLRGHIESRTRCTASVGIGPSILLAKLALKNAKPNGVAELWDTSTLPMTPVSCLPGVGWRGAQKLEEVNVSTAGELVALGQLEIQRIFGAKLGAKLFDFALGNDHRELQCAVQRKSLACDINYGIRLNNEVEVQNFLLALAREVSQRLQRYDMKGRQMALHLMVRSADAPVEPSKFLGHGLADNISRQVRLPSYTFDAKTMASEALRLYKRLNVPANELRGIGIHMSELVSCESIDVDELAQSVVSRYLIKPVSSSSSFSNTIAADNDDVQQRQQPPRKNQKAAVAVPVANADLPQEYLPSPSQIDPAVWSALPRFMRNELRSHYKHVAVEAARAPAQNEAKRRKKVALPAVVASTPTVGKAGQKNRRSVFGPLDRLRKRDAEPVSAEPVQQLVSSTPQQAAATPSASHFARTPASGSFSQVSPCTQSTSIDDDESADNAPSSQFVASQAPDPAVLRELPESIRAEVLAEYEERQRQKRKLREIARQNRAEQREHRRKARSGKNREKILAQVAEKSRKRRAEEDTASQNPHTTSPSLSALLRPVTHSIVKILQQRDPLSCADSLFDAIQSAAEKHFLTTEAVAVTVIRTLVRTHRLEQCYTLLRRLKNQCAHIASENETMFESVSNWYNTVLAEAQEAVHLRHASSFPQSDLEWPT